MQSNAALNPRPKFSHNIGVASFLAEYNNLKRAQNIQSALVISSSYIVVTIHGVVVLAL